MSSKENNTQWQNWLLQMSLIVGNPKLLKGYPKINKKFPWMKKLSQVFPILKSARVQENLVNTNTHLSCNKKNNDPLKRI